MNKTFIELGKIYRSERNFILFEHFLTLKDSFGGNKFDNIIKIFDKSPCM